MVRKFLLSAVFVFVLVFLPVAVNAEGDITPGRLVIDGQEILDLSPPPIIVGGRTFVPFREVFERIGGVVGWHGGHRQVSLFYGSDVLVMTIDNVNANLNGRIVQMHTAPIIYEERTMIPLRFPAEAFGFDVSWESETLTAIIDTQGRNNGNNNNNNNDSPVINIPDLSTIPLLQLPPLPEPPVNDPPPTLPSDGHTDAGRLPPPGERPVVGDLARNVSAFPIQTIQHPQTTITELLTPIETGIAAYVAVASLPITGVHYFILPDNRLVVDIANAVSLISGNFYAPANLPITGVRASQFSNAPRVTRIVFDVVGAAEFSIALSADRRLLTVQFSQNRISGVFTQTDAVSDTLFIMGDILPSINVCTEGFPHYLTLNINNSRMDAEGGVFPGGVFAHTFVTGQRADGSSYVRVYVGDAWPSFSMAQSANAVAFMMHHGIEGVRYDSVNRELRIARTFEMDISQVQRINDYLRLRYTFVLPAAAEVLGRGEISVPDGFINSVSISRINGNVNLTFNTARVLAFSIYEEDEYYVIRAKLPRDVSQFIVVIDPGHGGTDPGTAHHGVVEKDLVLAISHKVIQLLDADPFVTAYMTRRTDTFVALTDRADFANNLDADLFVSVHANAAVLSPGVINTEVQGIETLYTVGELELSGNHSINSRQFSEIMQRHLIESTGARNRGLVNRPALVVMRDTSMPSAFLELGFVTSPEEAARLATIAYQWQLAHAIHQGILEALALLSR